MKPTDGSGSRLKATVDAESIRAQFPIFTREIGGLPLVYLDSAATSQTPSQVISAISDYYCRLNANVHRGVHTLSVEATETYEDARTAVSEFVGAPTREGVIWTRNTTESLNIVAYCWGDANVNEGDNIVTTAMEHHSDIVPWQQLSKRRGAELRIIPLEESGKLDGNEILRLIDDRTRIVAAAHMSNVLGVVNPVEELAKQAHQHGAIIVIDGAQSVPHFPVSMQALGCDFLAFSAHKMLGPTGVGVLCGRKELLDDMQPLMFGGDMILEVTYESAQWNTLPYKFEAGTPNIAGSIGTKAAIDYLQNIGMEKVWQHERELADYTMERFKEFERFKVIGPPAGEERGGVVSFLHEYIHPHDLGTFLDGMGIAIRTGHHCAMPLVHSYGSPAVARASFYVYNSFDEVDFLFEGLEQAEEFFSR